MPPNELMGSAWTTQCARDERNSALRFGVLATLAGLISAVSAVGMIMATPRLLAVAFVVPTVGALVVWVGCIRDMLSAWRESRTWARNEWPRGYGATQERAT